MLGVQGTCEDQGDPLHQVWLGHLLNSCPSRRAPADKGVMASASSFWGRPRLSVGAPAWQALRFSWVRT